ncbi:Protein of unknown function [Cotesia congregata]|uniref:Uncharacterized protein n=1 Tax=Cotesia congregata TaxID=51543 RepID=A0A8J2MPI4_COTCN|nr:Protein of unknown function [Cotesia congregata]
MDTGGDADNESVAEDPERSHFWSAKRKERNSPEPTDSQAKKKKDLKPSPPKNMAVQYVHKKEASKWQIVQSRKEKRKQAKEQLPK